jgi:hypothetical protein
VPSARVLRCGGARRHTVTGSHAMTDEKRTLSLGGRAGPLIGTSHDWAGMQHGPGRRDVPLFPPIAPADRNWVADRTHRKGDPHEPASDRGPGGAVVTGGAPASAVAAGARSGTASVAGSGRPFPGIRSFCMPTNRTWRAVTFSPQSPGYPAGRSVATYSSTGQAKLTTASSASVQVRCTWASSTGIECRTNGSSRFAGEPDARAAARGAALGQRARVVPQSRPARSRRPELVQRIQSCPGLTLRLQPSWPARSPAATTCRRRGTLTRAQKPWTGTLPLLRPLRGPRPAGPCAVSPVRSL